ncbi:hypothetical protein BDW75DRAFT_13280 [Aspergillus navahoensis]
MSRSENARVRFTLPKTEWIRTILRVLCTLSVVMSVAERHYHVTLRLRSIKIANSFCVSMAQCFHMGSYCHGKLVYMVAKISSLQRRKVYMDPDGCHLAKSALKHSLEFNNVWWCWGRSKSQTYPHLVGQRHADLSHWVGPQCHSRPLLRMDAR